MRPLLEARDVAVRYPRPRSLGDWLLRRPVRAVRAVDGVSLSVRRGETLGVVGESGCGKSTLGRALLGLEPVAAGEISLDGEPVTAGMAPAVRRRAQMIFQDPVGALNPRLSVAAALAEPIRVHGLAPEAEIPARVRRLMGLVGLRPELGDRRPGELSGGQCQRVGIARALAVEPELIVADECVSALDVSVQAQVLRLLADLRERLGLTLVFISHDLGVVRAFCDRVAVLYLGRVVEEGPVERVLRAPAHPYTRALIDAVPELRPDAPPPGAGLAGEPPNPDAAPEGCAFHPRCPHAFDACRRARGPALLPSRGGRVACLLNDGAGLSAEPERRP